jgi:AraC-like DNA-binding protein
VGYQERLEEVAERRADVSCKRMRPAEGESPIVFQQVPCAALKRFIRRFVIVEFPTNRGDVHLPDLGAVVAFSIRGTCVLAGGRVVPAAALTGIHEKYRTHLHRDRNTVLIVSFTAIGANALLRVSLDTFAASTEDMSDVLGCGAEVSRLMERLYVAPNHGRRIAWVEDFFLDRLSGAVPDTLVEAALQRIDQAGSPLRVDELASWMGLSQSALERRFRKTIGVAPKRIMSLVRVKRAIQIGVARHDLAMVAYEAGYYDQSHFIHEFSRVTGQTPGRYFEARRPRCSCVSEEVGSGT